jgi:hypothetical protein
MAKLLTPKELKALKKGTKVKSITGKILTIGTDKVYADDTRFGYTPYSVYGPRKKK